MSTDQNNTLSAEELDRLYKGPNDDYYPSRHRNLEDETPAQISSQINTTVAEETEEDITAPSLSTYEIRPVQKKRRQKKGNEYQLPINFDAQSETPAAQENTITETGMDKEDTDNLDSIYLITATPTLSSEELELQRKFSASYEITKQIQSTTTTAQKTSHMIKNHGKERDESKYIGPNSWLRTSRFLDDLPR